MKEFIGAQFQNLFLWALFVAAAGGALYFSISFEPVIVYPFIIVALIVAILIFRRTSVITTAILLFIFGFMYSVGFTRIINTPQMAHTLRNHEITGTVSNIDYMNEKNRVFIRVPANQINKNISANKIATIRVSLGEDQFIPSIGSTISARVTLFRPSGAYAPGTFDYAQWAYFNGISATGYINEYTNISGYNSGDNINSLRSFIHNKTNSFLSDTLVLGYKNAVSKSDSVIWTATGIGHVWSISGFHMTLVGGWLSVLFYFIFRSIPVIARRIPARYPAIACAWVGLLFYLFLSGLDVATVRAFLMTTLIFAALIFGRNSFSLRNICMVFGIIFLINPHYIMQAGFQLSFAAIFGMAWFFQEHKYIKRNIMQKAMYFVKSATMVSIIATVFTATFVAYHFYSFPIYSLIGNLVLLPIFSFAIMPLVLVGTITALMGITSPLVWASYIYDWALVLATRISNLPAAQLQIPHISGAALLLIIFGFLCLMFIKNPGRIRINVILFSGLVLTGITTVIITKKPAFYATYDNELVGFVVDDKLRFNKSRASNHYFAFDTWKQLNTEPTKTENKRYKCDNGVCNYHTPNWSLVYIQKYVPLSKNIVSLCNDSNIDFIVSYFKIDAPKCNHKILYGGFVIYKNGKIKYTPTNRYWHIPH